MRRATPRMAGVLAALVLPLSAAAEQANTLAGGAVNWNAGVGAAALFYPAWRGASETESLALPLPVVSFWTEHADIGRGGLRVQSDLGGGWAIRLSVSGALPVDSDASPLREGLPDLDPTLEAGPALGWTSADRGPLRWRLETLVRGVFTVDLAKPEWLGWTVQPRAAVFWTRGDADQGRALQLRATLGPLWAQDKQHRYYYEVRAEDALANPRLTPYAASGGYSGARASLSGTWIRGRMRLSAYVSYDDLRGTAFADSPLRPEEDYWLVGTFVSWRIWGAERPLRLDE